MIFARATSRIMNIILLGQHRICCKVFIITLKTASTSRISIPGSNSLKPNFPTALKSKIHTRIKTHNLTKYQIGFQK